MAAISGEVTMPTNESSAPPKNPITKRSILWHGPDGMWSASGLPCRLLRYNDWVTLLAPAGEDDPLKAMKAAEATAERLVNDDPNRTWGEPYKDQSPEAGDEDQTNA
jgi:hypothetical protein